MTYVAARQPKVLWLEDVPKSIRANVELLRRSGFDVSVAVSLKDAVRLASDNAYVAIIVDYSIPRDSNDVAETNKGLGLEFIRQLKNGEFGAINSAARIVLCTAQRESVGHNRAELDRMKVEIMPKSNSYYAIEAMSMTLRGQSK